jgi:hypothetical protein
MPSTESAVTFCIFCRRRRTRDWLWVPMHEADFERLQQANQLVMGCCFRCNRHQFGVEDERFDRRQHGVGADPSEPDSRPGTRRA